MFDCVTSHNNAGSLQTCQLVKCLARLLQCSLNEIRDAGLFSAVEPSDYLTLRCITYRFCWMWKSTPVFLRNNTNSRSSKHLWLGPSAGMLSTNRPHMHSAGSSPHQHSQSPCYWVPPPPPFLFFFFWFSHQLWAVSVCLPLFFSQSQLFSVTRHPACHLLPLFPGKLREWVHGKGQRQGGLEGWFGIDKATSVSDTNMASEPTAVLCCAPLLSCLPQRDWASFCPDLLALSIHVCPPPALTPSKLLFWLKQTVVWSGGALFSSKSALSCSKERGAFEWF